MIRAFASCMVVLAAAAGLMPIPASAQDAYPSKPIRIIVPFAVGGGSDIVARVTAKELAQRIGQPVVVDNRPGAGGSVGANLALKSAPDGYTLLLVSSSYAVNPALYKLPFDSLADMTPVIELGSGPMIVTVNPQLPVKTLKELIDYARANPGKISFGSSGLGGLIHFYTEAFMLETSTRMVHIPYRGSADLIPDLLSGRIQLVLGDAGSVYRHIAAGSLRAIAVSGKNRLAELPQVPTLVEAGFTAFDMAVWQGLVAPKGTPEAVVAKLNAQLNEIVRIDEAVKAFKAQYYYPVGGTPAAFYELIKGDADRWVTVAKRANIKVE
ncbi:MAG TPA: tripartite tricarboxylate transporter substrate binding protein [Burkholderiales bacterium]|nr:tripartite tricarboxylate transporter substrate binding protein [Burkholderiales bacterium]